MSLNLERWFTPPHWLTRGLQEGLHRLEQLVNRSAECIESIQAFLDNGGPFNGKVCIEDPLLPQEWCLKVDPTTGDFQLVNETGGTIPVVVEAATGDVGFGTTNPVQDVHIHDAVGTNVQLKLTHSLTGATDADGASLGLVDVAAVPTLFLTNRDGPIEIFSDGLNRATVDGDGHVKMQGVVSALKLHVGTTVQRNAVPNPVRGMLWHNTDTLAYDGYFSATDTPSSGAWLPLSVFPDFFFGTHIGPTVTPTAVAGVPVQVVGVLTPSPNLIFYTLGGAGTNEWTYTGPTMGSLTKISYKGSVEKTNGGVSETFIFEVTINGVGAGVALPVSTRQNEPVIFEAEHLVSLNNGDVVSLQATNLASTDSITVQALYCSAGV